MNANRPTADLAEEPSRPLPAAVADASTHQLRPDVVSLPQSVVIGVATSAPGQSTAVALAGMVAVAAYATGPAIILSMIPMLAIAALLPAAQSVGSELRGSLCLGGPVHRSLTSAIWSGGRCWSASSSVR